MRNSILLVVFIALFGLAAPAFAKGAAHQAERSKTAYSINSKQTTTISFSYKSGEVLKIYWLDFKGDRKLYRELPAGGIHNQQTTISKKTTTWRIQDH